MPLDAFGKGANEYATRLPPDLNMIVFDDIDFGDALTDALERAYNSRPFFVAPIITDRRSAVALESVSAILNSETAYWKRREGFERLRNGEFTAGGRSQAEREAITKKEKDSIADILRVADCVVTRSWSELVRQSQLVDFKPIRSARAVAKPRIPVPPFRPRKGADSIVVWAPELDAIRAAIFAFALEELKAPVTIFCAGTASCGSLGLRARFVEHTNHAELERHLDQAAALIDGSIDDPATAIELAALGLPTAASFVSGAYEYVDGLYLYDAWDFRSMLHVALSALGGEPPVPRSRVPRPEDLLTDPPRLEPPTVENPPLVSVVMSTLNRHAVLPRAIDSIARQTYPNVEVIVVNDGGRPVDEIVNRLPRVTIINHDAPMGAVEAMSVGQRAARGTYIAGLSDDDYFFPDHLSRLIYALERTGGAVATSMCAESYYQPGGDGAYDYIGTSIMAFSSTDPTVLLTKPFTLAISGAVTRRAVFDAMGQRDRQAANYDDYEWNLRVLQQHDYIWVARLLANYDTRLDESNASRKLEGSGMHLRVSQLSYIWSKYSYPDRPDIEAARESLLNYYRGAGGVAPPQRGVTRIREPRRSALRLE